MIHVNDVAAYSLIEVAMAWVGNRNSGGTRTLCIYLFALILLSVLVKFWETLEKAQGTQKCNIYGLYPS